jgi:hypothetical protein
LPAGKARGLGTIGIDARKSLPVRIVDGHLPMAMLSTPVLAQCGVLFGFLQGFFQLWSQKYLKFSSPPQVLVKITRQPRIWPIFRVFSDVSYPPTECLNSLGNKPGCAVRLLPCWYVIL